MKFELRLEGSWYLTHYDCTYNPLMSPLSALMGYKCSYSWLRSTMNLQATHSKLDHPEDARRKCAGPGVAGGV